MKEPRGVLREPLVHFVVLGVALFALQRWVAPAGTTRRIVVGPGIVEGLRQDHLRRLGRLPTPEEEAGLVHRWVDDEVRYREALALGLDRGDVIVRRRLVQKMEFLAEGAEPIPLPTDAELQAYLDAHADRYHAPDRVTLTHVFAARDRHGAETEAIAELWRADLLRGASPVDLGDPFPRGRDVALQSEDQLAGIFGPELAQAAMALPVGTWSPPLPSSYGVHVVRVSEHRAGGPPPLAAVRARVLADWREDRRAAIDQAALERLRARYDIRVEHAP